MSASALPSPLEQPVMSQTGVPLPFLFMGLPASLRDDIGGLGNGLPLLVVLEDEILEFVSGRYET